MHHSLAPYLEHVEAGRIRIVEKDGLVLFNYTDACTFERHWDQYTKSARGIIFEKETGKIVAKPFDKFFNYSEYERIFGKSAIEDLRSRPHYIQQKMDGSLGIIYWWNDNWQIATRGSFTSDQALRGYEIFKKYNWSQMVNGFADYTFLVEIIYPENRIIVPYHEEKLVLLAIRNKITGHYISADVLNAFAKDIMPVVQIDAITIDHALERKKVIPHTEEGWVIVFDNGERIKIKGNDYIRIAKFMANLSPIAVWEAITLGRYHELALGCPEECRMELEAIYLRLMTDFHLLKSELLKVIYAIDFSDKRSRKEIALEIQAKPQWMHSMLFVELSKKGSIDQLIWKLLRPDGNTFASSLNIVSS